MAQAGRDESPGAMALAAPFGVLFELMLLVHGDKFPESIGFTVGKERDKAREKAGSRALRSKQTEQPAHQHLEALDELIILQEFLKVRVFWGGVTKLDDEHGVRTGERCFDVHHQVPKPPVIFFGTELLVIDGP